jgi:putative salt-induced outer membrane protein YdiY
MDLNIKPNYHIRKLVVVVIAILSGLPVFSQNDTLYTVTGDRLVGEIVSMKLGVLTFDTDYADDEFQIEWLEVEGLQSDNFFIVYTRDGRRLIGSIKYVEGAERIVRVNTFTGSISVSLYEIVEIKAVESKFKDRIKILLDAGYSFSKANTTHQLSISANVNYQAEKWLWQANYNQVGTYQEQIDPSSRTSGGSSLNYFLKGKLFVFAGVEFLSNSEQKLDLRRTSQAGVGYYIFRTNRWYFGTGAGLARSYEKYGGDMPTSAKNFEGMGILDINAYDIGDLDVKATINLYPGLTTKGMRVNSELSVKYDLPLEFYIRMSFTHDYDSDPAIDVSKSDFVFQTSIGWEWD